MQSWTTSQVHNINLAKIPSLNPAFKNDGTITAANASTLNDGAAAMVIMSETNAASLGLKPVARWVECLLWFILKI